MLKPISTSPEKQIKEGIEFHVEMPEASEREANNHDNSKINDQENTNSNLNESGDYHIIEKKTKKNGFSLPLHPF